MHLVFIFFVCYCLISYPQDSPAYHISAEAGGGYSRYLSTLNTIGLNKNGFTFSLSFLWQPEHLLEAGIETGYYHMYTFEMKEMETLAGNTDAVSTMTGLPLLLIFRMRVWEGFRIHGGSGIALLFNSGEIFNDRFSSSLISITDYIGISYSNAILKDFVIGGAFKYNYLFKPEEAFISLQLTASYRILSW